ncbi:hypothetical protein HYX19_04240 [Candidatus Woesearchaeota archaeon]|nr:hypothetical protein [Candidatus Woesearchaeota archaeon]
MLKFLGFMDLFTGLMFIILKLNITNFSLILFWLCVVYIIIKSISFPFTFGTLGDIISLFFLFLSFYGVFNLFSWLAMIWYIQKGLLSIIS